MNSAREVHTTEIRRGTQISRRSDERHRLRTGRWRGMSSPENISITAGEGIERERSQHRLYGVERERRR